MERGKIKPMNGYPIGFRFRPSEDDLFFHYLTKKVEGESEAIPPFMPEVDIYCDEDPWEIFDANSRENFYVFTRLKKIKSRVKRTAGSGTWSNGNKRKIMDGRGKVVGYNKLFTFKLSAGSEKMENGHWTMHEYSMNGHELALCVITNQTRNEPARRSSNTTICYDNLVTSCMIGFEGSTEKIYTPPSSSFHSADAPNTDHNNIDHKNYPEMLYEITFEGHAIEDNVPPSSWTQASNARDYNHGDVGFCGSPLMAAVGPSILVQPWTTGSELAPYDLIQMMNWESF